MAPPNSDNRNSHEFVAILKALGYLSNDGTDTYWGPPYTAGEGWKRNQWNEWCWMENFSSRR